MSTLLKVVLLGDPGVGKTGLFNRFIDNTFSENTTPTITDFGVVNREIDGRKVITQIWDTPGAMTFEALLPSFFNNANGIILVYDISSHNSFQNILSKWMGAMEQHGSRRAKDCIIMLVGNKSDLARQITTHAGETLARNNDFSFIETSARTNDNISIAFDKIIKGILATQFTTTATPVLASTTTPPISRVLGTSTKIVELAQPTPDPLPPSSKKCGC